MSFLIALLERFGHIVLFVIFELIAFTLIINFNQKQKDIFLHSSSLFSGSILKKTAQIGDYMSLEDSNNDLLKDNARLFEEIINMPRQEAPAPDTSQIEFSVTPARIINNSIISQRNHFTINKGKKDGITAAMGVITSQGVAGIVKSSNEHYALVLSLLNMDSRISASIKDQSSFGTVTWSGNTFRELKLSEVPTHSPVQIGDPIVTNGYSTIFPEGLELGHVKSFDISKNGAFYDIVVESAVDFSSLGHVYVLKSNFADQIRALEEDE